MWLEKLNVKWQKNYALVSASAFVIGVVSAPMIALSMPGLQEAQTFWAALIALLAAVISARAIMFAARHKEDRLDERRREEVLAKKKRSAAILKTFLWQRIDQSRDTCNELLRASLFEAEEIDVEHIYPSLGPESPYFFLVLELPHDAAGIILGSEQHCHALHSSIVALKETLVAEDQAFDKASSKCKSFDASYGELLRKHCSRIQSIKFEFIAGIESSLENLVFDYCLLLEIQQTGETPSQQEQQYELFPKAYRLAEELLIKPTTEPIVGT